MNGNISDSAVKIYKCSTVFEYTKLTSRAKKETSTAEQK
jgi:hypothetical protein